MRPLSGIRVLDVTRIIAGPTATFWLAALGAEVVRIEAPGGDVSWLTRPYIGPERDSDIHDDPRQISISGLRKHRGKRSMVLDLGNPAGRDVLRALVGVSDVLVENFKAGTMHRFGLGWPELEALNPRLVYASITGYGHDGPYRDKPAMDPIVQALSGFMAKTGFADGPPTRAGATIGDQLPGMWAALGVLGALRQRDHDGRGQLVDVAMLDAMLTLMWDEPLDLYEDTGQPERLGNGDPRGAPFDTYATSDGWLALAAPANSQWDKLAPFLGGAALDERWRDHATRARERQRLDELITAYTSVRSTADCVRELEPLGIPVAPVNPPWWARHDPHVQHRGSLERLHHPDRAEPTRWLGPTLPIRFSRADTSTAPAEPLGASTEAVLTELLGYDATAIAELRAAGAFG